MPVIPGTCEAEAGELLELGRWRLRRAQRAPLHSNLGDRLRLHLKRKKKRMVDEASMVALSTLGGRGGWITRSGV